MKNVSSFSNNARPEACDDAGEVEKRSVERGHDYLQYICGEHDTEHDLRFINTRKGSGAENKGINRLGCPGGAVVPQPELLRKPPPDQLVANDIQVL